jgi:hypothetical protein
MGASAGNHPSNHHITSTPSHPRFEPGGDISGMVSIEGEVVPLATRIRPAAANGTVEKWLAQVGDDLTDSFVSVARFDCTVETGLDSPSCVTDG